MATIHKNLSAYDTEQIPSATDMSFAIIISEWNYEITKALAEGAKDTLTKHGAKEKNIHFYHVPGSYELPLGTQFVLEHSDPDAVICVGSVIKGETSHFDYVCQAVSQGVKDVGLAYNKPVIFCVLTDNNLQQAKDRSGGKHGNKGVEAAVAAIKMTDLKRRLIE